MKALVTYDSKFGNTEQVAQAIADTLGEEGIGQLISVDEADALELEGVDLLVLGGPIQRHGLSPAVRAWLELIPRGVMRGPVRSRLRHLLPDAPMEVQKRRRSLGSAAASGSSSGQI